MLQAFTGMSKVEKAQSNLCHISIEKFGQQSQQNKSPTKSENEKSSCESEKKFLTKKRNLCTRAHSPKLWIERALLGARSSATFA